MDKLQIRILLLEDNDADVILLQEALRDDPLAAFECQVTDRLSVGMRLAQEQRFDAVLLDLGLPDSQGLATFEKMHVCIPALPIVVLSGVSDEQLAIQAVQAGAQDYLVKGMDGFRVAARAIRYAIERYKMQAALHASEHRFRALIEHNSDAIIMVSGAGEILYESPATSRIMGYEPAERVGHDAFELLHPEERERFFELFSQLVRQPEISMTAQFRQIHKNGTVRWAEGTATNLLNEPDVQAVIVNYRDITERKRAEEELERFFQFIPDMACIASVNGYFKKVNQEWEAVLGYSEAELLEMPFAELIHPDDRAATWQEVERQLDGSETIHFINRYRAKDGAYHWFDWNASPSPDGVQLFAVARDITERKAAEEVLQRAHDELEDRVRQRTKDLEEARLAADAANRAKSEFLANMSHELRTPLNSILGYAQILEKADNLHERQREGVRTIRESGEHLLTLITDILDMSKIEAGRMDVRPQEFHLQEFLKRIAKMIRIRAEQKRVSFVMGLDPLLPEYVASDERRLRQVLVNLLGNAIKFTDQGRVSLNVTCSNAEADRLLLRFEIADTGVGIAPDDLSILFQPFRQVGARRYAAEGTGLGLAISAKFIELLGGVLQVESEFGRGSRFWFELPVKTFSTPEALAADYFADDVTGYAGERRAILVVDDKAANRAILVNMLEPLGFQVFEADDGLSGLEVALARRPDLILLDLRMPGMDGFEMARQLRAQPAGQAFKVVAVSASVQGDIKQLCRDAGCDDFLGKPVMFEELLRMLAAQLDITWLTADQTPIAENETLVESAPSPAAIALPPELAAQLSVASERGDIRAVIRLLDQLAERDPRYGSFVEQLRQMAKNFQVDEIANILRNLEP